MSPTAHQYQFAHSTLLVKGVGLVSALVGTLRGRDTFSDKSRCRDAFSDKPHGRQARTRSQAMTGSQAFR